MSRFNNNTSVEKILGLLQKQDKDHGDRLYKKGKLYKLEKQKHEKFNQKKDGTLATQDLNTVLVKPFVTERDFVDEDHIKTMIAYVPT